jgi:pyridoxine 5-phosphate synthase
MIGLGVNIDHVATLREARRGVEPDPVWAAVEAQLGGAACITMHLREDRRHIRDEDLPRVQSACRCKVNLECAATDEILGIVERQRPHMATLVPEGRAEVTTEGGLDMGAAPRDFREAVRRLHEADVTASAFLDPEPEAVDRAAEADFDCCELHTGPWAHACASAGGELHRPEPVREHTRLLRAAERVRAAGMRLHGGHALDYLNTPPVARIEGMRELHIGHALVARAVFVGLRGAVAEMRHLLGGAAGSLFGSSEGGPSEGRS